MERYAPTAKDLASRDVVSRSMTLEIREGRYDRTLIVTLFTCMTGPDLYEEPVLSQACVKLFQFFLTVLLVSRRNNNIAL